MLNASYPPDTEIAIRLGVAIAHQNLDVLQGLDLTDARIHELKSAWYRLESAFLPEERVWFKQVLKGIVPQQPSVNLGKLKPTTQLIRLTDLIGYDLAIEGEVFRQLDGTIAVSLQALPQYIDAANQRRWQSIQAAFNLACR